MAGKHKKHWHVPYTMAIGWVALWAMFAKVLTLNLNLGPHSAVKISLLETILASSLILFRWTYKAIELDMEKFQQVSLLKWFRQRIILKQLGAFCKYAGLALLLAWVIAQVAATMDLLANNYVTIGLIFGCPLFLLHILVDQELDNLRHR